MPKKKPQQAASSRAPGILSTLGYILTFFMAGPLVLAAVILPLRFFAPEARDALMGIFDIGTFVITAQLIGVLAVALLLRRSSLKRGWSLREIGFKAVPLRTYLKYLALYPLVIIAMIAAIGLIVSTLISVFGYDPAAPQNGGNNSVKIIESLGGPKAFIMAVLVAPVIEEILFRGLLFKALRRRFAFPAATVITSLVFGLAHLNPLQAISATLFSPYACWMYERTGSIYPGMLIHGVWNAFVFAVVMSSL